MVQVGCADEQGSSAGYLSCANSILESFGVKPISDAADEILTDPESTVSRYLFGRSISRILESVDSPIVASLLLGVILMQALALFELARATVRSRLVFSQFHSWAVDAPPILGICGTLVALIGYLSAVEASDNLSGFLAAFSTAASTTLVGAVTSVINQGMLAYARSRAT
jgi:hypothetical protein